MKAVVKATVDGFASPSQPQGQHISSRHKWHFTAQPWLMPPVHIRVDSGHVNIGTSKA